MTEKKIKEIFDGNPTVRYLGRFTQIDSKTIVALIDADGKVFGFKCQSTENKPKNILIRGETAYLCDIVSDVPSFETIKSEFSGDPEILTFKREKYTLLSDEIYSGPIYTERVFGVVTDRRKRVRLNDRFQPVLRISKDPPSLAACRKFYSGDPWVEGNHGGEIQIETRTIGKDADVVYCFSQTVGVERTLLVLSRPGYVRPKINRK